MDTVKKQKVHLPIGDDKHKLILQTFCGYKFIKNKLHAYLLWEKKNTVFFFFFPEKKYSKTIFVFLKQYMWLSVT